MLSQRCSLSCVTLSPLSVLSLSKVVPSFALSPLSVLTAWALSPFHGGLLTLSHLPFLLSSFDLYHQNRFRETERRQGILSRPFITRARRLGLELREEEEKDGRTEGVEQPPDFNPSKLPRVRRPKNQQIKVRMILPVSIRCNTCGDYISKGTKFNSRREDVIGETYLGIQIFRFYIKCTKRSAELTMKTDPQNSDYVVKSGVSRNFEPWREKDEVEDCAC